MKEVVDETACDRRPDESDSFRQEIVQLKGVNLETLSAEAATADSGATANPTRGISNDQNDARQHPGKSSKG